MTIEMPVGLAGLSADIGHPAHPTRIALGALIIKQRLRCSDEWTVRHVSENPYLQYVLGLKEYTSKCPFGASTIVEFRKRFPPKAIEALLTASVPEDNRSDEDSNGSGGADGTVKEPSECGVYPARVPQDICDRNIVEGEFGTGKRAYGLGRIMAHLPETSFCVIGIALLCMNLAKRLRFLLLSFFQEWTLWLFHTGQLAAAGF